MNLEQVKKLVKGRVYRLVTENEVVYGVKKGIASNGKGYCLWWGTGNGTKSISIDKIRSVN